jgi:hypothetical protein
MLAGVAAALIVALSAPASAEKQVLKWSGTEKINQSLERIAEENREQGSDTQGGPQMRDV